MDAWLTKPTGDCSAPLLLIAGALIIGCTSGCELTPGLEPLVCSCGKHSARLQPEGTKKRNWQIFAVKKEGNKPRIVTMKAEKHTARDVVLALCDGSYQQQNRPAAAPTQPTRTVRHREASRAQNTSCAAPRATRIAGPGSGHKGVRVSGEGAVEETERVLKKPKPSEQEWRHALGRLTTEHKLLQQWCDKVCAHVTLQTRSKPLSVPSSLLALSRATQAGLAISTSGFETVGAGTSDL
jgi:hypothetical protein